MKKLIKSTLVLILFLFSFNVSAQPEISNQTGSDTELYESVLNLIAPELDLDTANIQIIISDMKFDDAYSGKEYAIVRRYNDKIFTINMNRSLVFRRNKIKAFIHELKHVSQMYKKRLVVVHTSVWFEGKVYAHEVPYHDRTYEIEAIEMADKLFSKYRKSF